ncbi:MAG: DUF3568 family protein [Deltaproteobacteria bacterium]|nr:DUF3568 family protein [Deltaproteobacteria bacterium]
MTFERRRFFLTSLIFIMILCLTACQATIQGSTGKGSYELKRSITMPNFWEVLIDGDVNNVYDAALKGVNDMGLKIYSRKMDSLSAIVEGSFADETEYSVRISYDSPSRTMMRIKAGHTGNKTLSLQLFQAIEKHLN